MNSTLTITIGYDSYELENLDRRCFTTYEAFLSCRDQASILRTTFTWNLLKLWNATTVRFIEFENFTNENFYTKPDNRSLLGALATGIKLKYHYTYTCTRHTYKTHTHTHTNKTQAECLTGYIDYIFETLITLTAERFKAGIRYATPTVYYKLCFKAPRQKLQKTKGSNNSFFIDPFPDEAYFAGSLSD